MRRRLYGKLQYILLCSGLFCNVSPGHVALPINCPVGWTQQFITQSSHVATGFIARSVLISSAHTCNAIGGRIMDYRYNGLTP